MSTLALPRPLAPAFDLRGVVLFARACVKSMRSYYAFVTGIAVWIGVAYAQRLHPVEATGGTAAIALAILFLAWGINQIINDSLGRREDRINAPHRPMVSGELHPTAAVGVSVALLSLSALVAYRLSPPAALPLVIGALPAVGIGLALATGWIAGSVNPVFLLLFGATMLLQVRTGVLYHRHASGPQAYFSLATNFRACACGQAMLIALFDPLLSVFRYVATYLLIGLLFRLHRAHRA